MRPVGVLLDTNVASYLVRRSIESRSYERLIRGRTKYLSVISVAELRYGGLRKSWGYRKTSELQSFIEAATIVPVCQEIASVVADVRNRRELEGRRMDWCDAWIAATAIFHKLPLVTHDRDFVEVEGLELISDLHGVEVREPSRAMRTTLEATPEAAMEWMRRYLATLGVGLRLAV
jgi:predicted nucleic acid-binding protein